MTRREFCARRASALEREAELRACTACKTVPWACLAHPRAVVLALLRELAEVLSVA